MHTSYYSKLSNFGFWFDFEPKFRPKPKDEMIPKPKPKCIPKPKFRPKPIPKPKDSNHQFQVVHIIEKNIKPKYFRAQCGKVTRVKPRKLYES